MLKGPPLHSHSCRRAALAAPLELVALGCASGEVLLVRLAPPLGPDDGAPGGGDGGGDGPHGRGLLGRTPSLGGRAPAAARPQQQRQLSGALSGVFPFGAAGYGGAADAGALVRTLHLGDWGHGPAQTGAVGALDWAPDCRALAVGYARQGLVVWSASGCRLLSTARQRDAAWTPRAAAAAAAPAPGGAAGGGGGSGGGSGMDGGVQALAWGPLGYSLVLACGPPGPAALGSGALQSGGGGAFQGSGGGGARGAPGGAALFEVQFAKAPRGSHRVAQVAGGGEGGSGELHLLQAADRLLLISDAAHAARGAPWHASDAAGGGGARGGGGGGANGGAGGSDLSVSHVPLPAGYLESNWPLVHAAAAPGGGEVAAAGRRGLAVHSRHSGRWRLFGDVSQVRPPAGAASEYLCAQVLHSGWCGWMRQPKARASSCARPQPSHPATLPRPAPGAARRVRGPRLARQLRGCVLRTRSRPRRRRRRRAAAATAAAGLSWQCWRHHRHGRAPRGPRERGRRARRRGAAARFPQAPPQLRFARCVVRPEAGERLGPGASRVGSTPFRKPAAALLGRFLRYPCPGS
jgi:hypothetical protein